MIQSPPEASTGRTARVEHASAWLQVTAGLLAVLVAALGIVSYNKTRSESDAHKTADALQQEMDATKARIDDLNHQLDAAQASTAKAQKALQVAGLPPLGPDNSGDGAVLRQGQLTLTAPYTADLDTSAPDWNAQYAVTVGNDIYNAGNFIQSYSTADFAILESTDSESLATCRSKSNYAMQLVRPELAKGLRFCVRTSSKNHALLRIDTISDNGPLGAVTFTVIVWKG